MRIGFIITLVTIGVLAHVYSDGRITTLASTLLHGKNIRMLSVAIAGLGVYNLYKSLSGQRKFELMKLTNEYLSNGQLSPLNNPIFDMTQYNRFKGGGQSIIPITAPMQTEKTAPILELLQPIFDSDPRNTNENGMDLGFSKRSMSRLQNSGMIANGKRSVSAAKRKYIAASQNWRCAHCKNVLSSFFEIDHVIRIADLGDNHISNLNALCLNCHRYKTEQQR